MYFGDINVLDDFNVVGDILSSALWSIWRCVRLPEWTGMGRITGMDYRNGP